MLPFRDKALWYNRDGNVVFAKLHLPFLSLAGICLLLLQALPAQVPAAQSTEAVPAVHIDGQTGDWSASRLMLDGKSGAEIAFQNDGRVLYVLFIVKKPEPRVSLQSTGLMVLARKEGSKTSRGVLFLKRTVPAETYIRWRESRGELLTEAEKAKLRDSVQHDIYFAFAVGAGGSIYGPLRRIGESEPPESAVSEAASETIYELKIPLLSPDLVPGGLGAAPGENVRISFEWGGTSRGVLSPKTTEAASALDQRADVSGSGVTWGQEYIDSFDSLSRPTKGTKKFSFSVDLRLAEAK